MRPGTHVEGLALEVGVGRVEAVEEAAGEGVRDGGALTHYVAHLARVPG